MNSLRTDVPEIRDEFCCFVKVYSTEPWWTVVPMNVDVEHPHLITQGNLQRLSDGRCPHHRPHAGVSDVIPVGHWMKTVSKQDPASRLERPYSARQESDTLSSKRVRSIQVIANVTEQPPSDLETYPHLSALKC